MNTNSISDRFKKAVAVALFFMHGGVTCARFIGVKVGSNCRIYIRDFGSEPFLVEIGDKVTVAAGVRFLTHDGASWLVEDEGIRYQLYGKILVGNNIFIGANAILMPGISIGDDCVIGAGSVVTRSVPQGSVVAGNPARIIKSFSDFTDSVKLKGSLDQHANFGSSRKARILGILKEKGNS